MARKPATIDQDPAAVTGEKRAALLRIAEIRER
jgi:hypothetical protein